MLDIEFNEEQKMLRAMARDFLEAECPETHVRQMEVSEKGYSPELWHKMAELGCLGLLFPEEYGGTGGNILDDVVLEEEMGRVIFPSPYLSTVVLCGLTILAAGNDEQKAELLPRIVEGDLILSLALTEPSASWDADGVSVSATAEGDEYVINGTKLFVHDAHIADYLLCVTRTRNGAKPEEGITLFFVDAKSPGISYTILDTVAGDKQSKVTFNKVRIPKENMLGELHNGWAPLSKTLQQGIVALCARMSGMGQFMVEKTVDYAKTRVQFDMPIGVHQWIQGYCIELLSYVEGIKWVTYKAAWKLSEGLPAEFEVAVAKAWSSDGIEQACLRSHSVLSGAGYMHEWSAQPLYTRRAKTLQLYLGDSAYHRKKLAQQMDNWVYEARTRGKPLGLWERKQGPLWTADAPGLVTSAYDFERGG